MGTKAVRREPLFLGAAVATLTAPLAVTFLGTATVLLRRGLSDSEWLPDAAGSLGFAFTTVGPVSTVIAYLAGIPIAHAIENRSDGGPRNGLLAYLLAGAAIGSLLGVLVFPSFLPMALNFGIAGGVSAVAGSVASRWASRRPESSHRRLSRDATLLLSAGWSFAWLATGLVVFPMAAAAVITGSVALWLTGPSTSNGADNPVASQ